MHARETMLNLTVSLQGRSAADQISYDRAFTDMGRHGIMYGYRALPYRTAATIRQWKLLYFDVLNHMRNSG